MSVSMYVCEYEKSETEERDFISETESDQDRCQSSDGWNGDQCLEKYVLLNEIRADALRETGLYDEYILLCKRALQQVGTFAFHERVFDSFTNLAFDNLTGYRADGLRNAAALERQRAAIELKALAEFRQQFGAEPVGATAVNVRSACCNGLWQAVAVDNRDGSRVWYKVEFLDDNDYVFLYIEDCDIATDSRYSIIEDLSRIDG
ncbi:MAG: hypothetical protein AB7G28_02805 [Pirellulales bacterium]